jgi:MoaA/NifB/PqqE/SkfB family radical SAM enzyme
MVSFIKQNSSSHVVISTNGHFLDKENIYKIIESRLDKLVISLDSTLKKTYQLIRQGGNFELVMNNLKRLSQIKKRGIQRPEIFLQFIISRINENEVRLMKKFAHDNGFKPEFRSLSSNNNELVPLNRKYRRNERTATEEFTSVNFCTAPWIKMAISCEGKVTMCAKSLNPLSFDMEDSPLVLGDIKKNTLDEIWNGHRYQTLRNQMLINKHLIGCPVRCPNPCFSLTDKIMS